jgi:hypothetical protein
LEGGRLGAHSAKLDSAYGGRVYVPGISPSQECVGTKLNGDEIPSAVVHWSAGTKSVGHIKDV